MKAHSWPLWIAAILFGLVAVGPTGAQDPKGTDSITAEKAEGITREQADAILNELRHIRRLLEKMQAQQPVPTVQPAASPERINLAVGADYWLGREDAPVTMVEFSDFQCPFCRHFHQTVFAEIRKNYVDTGKLRFISRDFPLDYHPNAMRAAQAARCAGEQRKYWEMRDLLLTNANSLGQEAILGYAQQLSLDVNGFGRCLESQKYLENVKRDIHEAEAVGVSGTPTFVLGKTTRDGVQGIKLVGAQPYAAFDSRLKQLLSSNP